MPEKHFDFGKTPTAGKHPPAWSKRDGVLNVALWENEATDPETGQVRKYASITFERRYKDKAGQWDSTGSLRKQDLLPLSHLLQQAYGHLITNEKEE